MQAVGKRLVHHYLHRRRETVIVALVEMRPDLLRQENVEQLFDLPDLDQRIANFVSRYNRGEVAFRGIWRDVWDYRLHGIGCEMRHRQTGEYLDWDINNPNTFYTSEMDNHLQWRMTHQPDDPDISRYMQWVERLHGDFDQLLALLAESGAIEPVNAYAWRIV